MPAGLSSGDRKILFIAAAAFLFLLVLGFFLAPSSNETPVATTYSSASEGAKAAYLLFEESGYRVERWRYPLTALGADKHTVLFLADPGVIPDENQKAALERFVFRGGRVITDGIIGASFLPEDFSQYNLTRRQPWSEFKALLPSPITRAAPAITLAPMFRWMESSAIPLYGSPQENVVVRYPHGEGDVIWLASATPFTNAGIRQRGNLEFLLAAVGDRSQTRVLFDEYVHGYGERDSRGSKHPLVSALFLQSVLLAVAVLFTFSRRSGPLRPIPATPRLAPLEFVETLGGLYRQARAGSVAVDIYYRRLQFWMTRRFGLPPDATPEQLDRAARERANLRDHTFVQTLHAARSARYQPDLPPKEALEIVRALYSYALRLRLFPAAKEKS